MPFTAPHLRAHPLGDFGSRTLGHRNCRVRSPKSLKGYPRALGESLFRVCRTGCTSISVNRGFTVLEVIMVIVIIGVLAVIVAVEYGPVTNARIRAAADKLKADIQYAQSLALNTRKNCGVTFSGNSYTVFENNDVADPAQDPLTKQNYVVNFNTGEFKDVTITSATFGSTSLVQFDRQGIPYDGSGAALPSASTSRRVLLNNSTQVIVTQTTGKVLIQ